MRKQSGRECYRKNSRTNDHHGRIKEVVNNDLKIGPTLRPSLLIKRHPDSYIIDT